MEQLLERNESLPLSVQIENAYMHGCSDVEICRLMRIPYPEFKGLYDSNPDFSRLVDVGRTMSQAYWMQEGRKNITNTKFNTSLWMFNMKNRFGWAEKAEMVNHDITPDNLDDLRTRLNELLPKALRILRPELAASEHLALVSSKGNA